MSVLPVGITFGFAATVAVALRLYTRIHLVCSPGWDDWTLLLALLTDYAFFAFLVIEGYYGLGDDESTLSPEDLQPQLKALWISIPLYNLSLNLAKISMLLLYLRIFPSKTYRIVLTCVLIFVAISGLWMVLSTLLFCIPIRSFWDHNVQGSCLSESVVWSLNAALQISTDLAIVFLPMPALVKLRIPIRQKIALMLVFTLGLFVCVTSAIRLHAVVKLLNTTDISGDNGPAASWSFIETNVAIFCASLPPLAPLIIRYCPCLMPSQSRQRHKPPMQVITFTNPFDMNSTGYSASVTGNCSVIPDARDSTSYPHAGPDAIQVVSELRLDSNPISDENAPESQATREHTNSTGTGRSVRFS